MRKHRRIRKVLKWTSVVALSFLLIAWVFSMSAWLYYVGDHHIVGLSSGRIDMQLTRGNPSAGPYRLVTTSEAADLIRPTLEFFVNNTSGLTMGRLRDRRPFGQLVGAALPAFEKRDYPALSYPGSVQGGPVTRYSAVVPLWALFIIGLVPTLWLMWRDLPYPPGHCQACRYDLRGSRTHRCPECGTPVPERPQANASECSSSMKL
jgi:hypothetical protein